MIEYELSLISGASLGIEFLSDEDFSYTVIDLLVVRLVLSKEKPS
jgi:hypothetical protein